MGRFERPSSVLPHDGLVQSGIAGRSHHASVLARVPSRDTYDASYRPYQPFNCSSGLIPFYRYRGGYHLQNVRNKGAGTSSGASLLMLTAEYAIPKVPTTFHASDAGVENY